MKDPLVRFGVAMEGSLLEEFDALVEGRGSTRSEALRDLVRGEITKARVSAGTPSVAALTLVYDHHVRELTERLTEFQHALGDKVNSTLHVHLDHDHCLEVIVMRGRSDELKRAAGKILATRGVKNGGIEIVALEGVNGKPQSKRPVHSHSHSHEHEHDGETHSHAHGHSHAPKKKRTKAATPAKPKRR